MEFFEMEITFNHSTYTAKYNKQTGYYEVELQAPEEGGIYNAHIFYAGLLDFESADQDIQILAKEEIRVETEKVFAWVFDYRDFKIKDIVEIADDYEINIDDETNTTSTIKVLKDTTSKANDIVAIKKER